MIVAGVAAFVARTFGVNPAHTPAAMVWFPPIDGLALGETLALAVLGPVLARWINIPAGAFLVPMIAGIVLTHLGLMSIELPTWLLAASYTLIGWNVGLRFTRPLLVHAARVLPQILACVFTMIVTVRRRGLADGAGDRRRSADRLSGDQPGRLGLRWRSSPRRATSMSPL